jgi:hypothetical protein
MNARKDTAPLTSLNIIQAILDKRIFGGLLVFRKIEAV